MIGNIVKFFTKLGCGISLGVIAFILVILAMADAAKSYIESSRKPENDMSYIVGSHQICERDEVGTVHMCCICKKYFTKTDEKINCCSPEHEREYQELYKAWVSGNQAKEAIESHGKKFQ